MKVFNFSNKYVQYFKENDVSKLFKIFQKPDKLFAINSIETSEINAKWDLENLEADVEILVVSKTDAMKIFNELILFIKEEIDEDYINVKELTGISVAIYDITEDVSIVLYADLDVQWKQKILQQMLAITSGIAYEYQFVNLDEFYYIKSKISKDILEVIEPRFFNKFNI